MQQADVTGARTAAGVVLGTPREVHRAILEADPTDAAAKAPLARLGG